MRYHFNRISGERYIVPFHKESSLAYFIEEQLFILWGLEPVAETWQSQFTTEKVVTFIDKNTGRYHTITDCGDTIIVW